MYDEIIKFRKYNQTEDKDEYGDPVLEIIDREVWAKVMSVGSKEFYQAQTLGMKLELKFEIADVIDYEGEEELVYNGVVYKIVRTYKKESNALELTCTGGVHRANA